MGTFFAQNHIMHMPAYTVPLCMFKVNCYLPTGITTQQFCFQVVSKDLVQEAVAFARDIAGKPFDDRRCSKRPVKGAENAVALRDGRH